MSKKYLRSKFVFQFEKYELNKCQRSKKFVWSIFRSWKSMFDCDWKRTALKKSNDGDDVAGKKFENCEKIDDDTDFRFSLVSKWNNSCLIFKIFNVCFVFFFNIFIFASCISRIHADFASVNFDFFFTFICSSEKNARNCLSISWLNFFIFFAAFASFSDFCCHSCRCCWFQFEILLFFFSSFFGNM